ncbi:MAG: menaquinone biosynthesis protein [Desulfobulbaceae bacterium]|nr:MAG: menaquinone biosynthesis protein [Desulfobulbaceae bacterium]
MPENTQIERTGCRIGMVNYINTAPIYEVWKETVRRQEWRVHEDAPAALCRMLAAGELDIGVVSCYEYGERPEDYRIMEDLSISANGPVGSVFLFSRVPMEALDGRLVLLSNQSKTSAALVRVALEEFAGVRPHYMTGEVNGRSGRDQQAVLAIGDDALRLVREGRYPHCYDLGEIWKRETGLPFVFAVFAVREEYCRQHPAELAEIHREFLRCRARGREEMYLICSRVAPRIPMACEDCYAYLRAIEHDLGAEKRLALEKFFGYLIARGECSPAALPLKIQHLPA